MNINYNYLKYLNNLARVYVEYKLDLEITTEWKHKYFRIIS